VLARAAAFGCTTAAYDPFVPAEAFAAAGVRALTADELFANAGILSLHLPLGESTRHFVNARTLALLRPDAILVNTARGALIDTGALAAALDAGTLAGAGLDVFEQEPLPADHPLRRSRNTLLTSHTAWYSTASIPALQQRAAETAALAVRGLPLRHVVNTALLRPTP
jgi:D-3-phosphoglycerate dehydrogenase